ncbi:MAG: hypothetical protein A2X78_00050 [Gammaproteobacteria bacterium GWE2_37_16]|nr:MAG: hypothetical protein A2X78_00050 [Gammaproteobacteria bacterium GWE2_37_16]
MQYIFDPEKNKKLKMERGVNFEDAILAIAEGGVLDVKKHPNVKKYPNQWVAILQIENYAYQMPFVVKNDFIFLKTVFASREATKYYLKNGGKL